MDVRKIIRNGVLPYCRSFLAMLMALLCAACLTAGAQQQGTAEMRCDTNAPWRLVFSDDFDGPAPDRSHWHTYGNWAGMETDNWSEARATDAGLCLYRDENVTVAGGVCTLSLRREDAAWNCDTCTRPAYQKQFTSGELFSYYTQSYSQGRFEARLKMPVLNGTHSTFWLWPSEAGQDAPEFDIAEGYGGRFWPTPFPQHNGRFTNFSIHRWGPSGHVSTLNRFPRQRWINALRGNFFDPAQWHIYAVEWEENTVKFFVDGRLVKAFSKYYYRNFLGIKRRARCGANKGKKLHRNFFFPPPTAGCNIRLTLALDKNNHPPAGLMAQMAVDYVRVWQRAPAP